MRMSNPAVWTVMALLLAPLCGFCQDEAAPEIDRTDPTAVARAYAEACRAGDTEAAVELVHPDDPLRPALAMGFLTEDGETGLLAASFARIFTELMFAPTKINFGIEDAAVEQLEDGTAQVTLRRTWAVDQKLALSEAEDGTWSIKALASVKATTGSEPVYMSTRAPITPGDDPDELPFMAKYDSQDHLRGLAEAFGEYADEHDSTLPPAASWVDAIEPYVLDRDLFACPGAPEQEYGYAMNVLADEIEMPEDWRDQRGLVILFEWRGAERNAAVMPEELADMEPFWPDGSIAFVDAGAWPERLPRGLTIAELAMAEEHASTCSSHLRALTRATLRHARDNDGMLPGADTWQDDIALYLLDDTGLADVFRCPAADGIDFAYAINSEIAGTDATEIRGHGDITLFFESDLNVANASGNPDIDGAAELRHVEDSDTGRHNLGGRLNGDVISLRPPEEDE